MQVTTVSLSGVGFVKARECRSHNFARAEAALEFVDLIGRPGSPSKRYRGDRTGRSGGQSVDWEVPWSVPQQNQTRPKPQS